MEELTRKWTSQKAYCSHLSRILNKVEDTLANDIDELALMYLKTAITQLEKKQEQIIHLDQQLGIIDPYDNDQVTIQHPCTDSSTCKKRMK